MKKTPWYSELTEAQYLAALAFARENGLAIESGGGVGAGEYYYVRILPTDPGAPEWTDDMISGLEAALADAE
jgi:hypothetical protein